jgi:hypothetical protein
MRWLEALSDFDLDISYEAGESALMRVPDALSRRPDMGPAGTEGEGVTQGLMAVCGGAGSFLERIAGEYAHDPFFGPLLPYLREPALKRPPHLKRRLERFELRGDGVICMDGRVCVPMVPGDKHLRNDLIHDVHDVPYAGHMGIDKTYLRLCRDFYWPGMYVHVRKWVSSCHACQINKARQHKQPGLLQPLPVPQKRWQIVSMDFIMDLPKTKQGHDAILVFVDTLSKMSCFVPCNTTISAEGTADLFIQHVFKHFGIPEVLVCDRDVRFTAHFWQRLLQRLGSRTNMASTGHAQTDGQTERVNRILEDLLRPYTSNWQDDWDGVKLSLAEFAYNSAVHSATGLSPFELMYGYVPHTPASMLAHGASSDFPTARRRAEREADAFVARMQALLQSVRDKLEEKKDEMAAVANRDRRDVTYSVGDRVLLHAKNIDYNTADGRRQTRKLLPRYLGPFRVVQVVSPVAYRLRLPPQIKMHDVFHVSMLQPYTDPRAAFPDRVSLPPPTILPDGSEGAQVEKILAHKRVGRVDKYLVLWLGQPVRDA